MRMNHSGIVQMGRGILGGTENTQQQVAQSYLSNQPFACLSLPFNKTNHYCPINIKRAAGRGRECMIDSVSLIQ